MNADIWSVEMIHRIIEYAEKNKGIQRTLKDWDTAFLLHLNKLKEGHHDRQVPTLHPEASTQSNGPVAGGQTRAS